MPTQYKRSWVLLTSFAACAGFATTPVFAVGPLDGAAENTAASRACMSLVASNAQAQVENVQITYLIKLLEGSSQFRVRAQAAISLGLMGNSLAARNALTEALQDEHPAVRAAAATSLGRIGEAQHVGVLRMLAGDPEEPVRNAARASITRLESAIEESAAALETAALSATTLAHRL